MKSILHLLAFSAAFMLLTACPKPDTEPIPVPRPDETVSLGQTGAITGQSLVAESLQSLLVQQADGGLAFSHTDAPFSLSFDILKTYDGAKPFARYCNYPIDYNFNLGAKPAVPAEAPEEIDLTGILPATIDLGYRSKGMSIYLSGLPEEVIALEGIQLAESSHFDVTLSIVSPFFTEGSVIPEFSVDMRAFFNSPEAVEGILHFDAPLTAANGYKATKIFHLDGVPFDPDNFDASRHNLRLDARVGLSGTVALEGLKTTKTRLAAAPADLLINVTVVLRDVSCTSVTGRFSYQTKAVTGTLNLPSALAAMAIDPAGSSVELDMTSNLSVPAQALVDLTTRRSRRTIAEVSGMRMPLAVAAPGSSTTSVFKLQEAGDLSPLFARVPDEFLFETSAATQEDQTCTVLLGQNNVVTLTPNVVIPFVPASTFDMSLADTLSVQSKVGTALKAQPLGLQGEMVNTLPLDVDMAFTLIDDTGRTLSRPVTQTFAAESTTAIRQEIVAATAATDNLSKAVVVYRIRNPKSPRPIRASDKLQATLNIIIPGEI